MVNLSILSGVLCKNQIKYLKRDVSSVESFLEKCYQNDGIDENSIDSDYETILFVEYTGTGVKIVCNIEEISFVYIDNTFLRFGLCKDEKIPFHKWHHILEFVLLDIDKDIDYASLSFSYK